MAATREQVAELVMKIFDKLEDEEFDGCDVEDAVVLVELSDNKDLVEIGGRMVPATVILLEATTDRVTIQGGILDFAQKAIIGEGSVDDE